MSSKLTRLDATLIDQHTKLTFDDEVYFWREYTSGRNYTFGPGNDLISNLKKKPSQASAGELYHKDRVINESSNFFRGAINPNWLADATLVPIPGSKAANHPDYDNRMTRIIQGIRPAPPLDIRELIVLGQSMNAAHEAVPGERPSVEDLLEAYSLNEGLLNPAPRQIGLFDDVLTAGVHYRACLILLRRKFPDIPIVGFFIARRVFPPANNIGPDSSQ
ncbi:hypothetical protein [Rhizobium rhizogenes]|uniref:hypothetical protein n=1 Tax=Rhizobium rhizogenes TaxID=359 RepID=UPI0012D31709|nr:hypothetical protein [Rhizobium rhizogenes]